MWKTWKSSRRYTCRENLRFDKEGYFHVLVFYGLFYKRNRKHFFPCSHTLEKHLCKIGRSRNSVETLAPRGLCSNVNFSFFQTSIRVSITVWKHGKCFLVYYLRQEVMFPPLSVYLSVARISQKRCSCRRVGYRSRTNPLNFG